MTPEQRRESFAQREQSKANYFLGRLIDPDIPSKVLWLERLDYEYYIEQLRLGRVTYPKTADELQALLDQRLAIKPAQPDTP